MKQKLSPEENRRAWRYAALIVAGLLAVGALGLLLLPKASVPLRIPAPGEAVTAAAEGLDEISVALSFDPAAPQQLTATQTLTLTNRTGQALNEAVLRSYSGAYLSLNASPAASQELYAACYGTTFSPGGLIVGEAAADGSPVAPQWLDGDARTVLRLPCETPWLPGETRFFTLTWHAAVPECASRFGHSGGVWALGNLIPTPALFLDGEWDQAPYLPVGDPFRSECANWQVTLTLPGSYTPAASVYAEPSVYGDTSVYRYVLPAARDFALAISDRCRVVRAMEGGTLVAAYAADPKAADAMLRAACRALRCYEALWGEYVYPTLTLCEVDFPFGGMEYPGLVMLGSSVVATGGKDLEYTVAHETAHQWWAVQVGSDSVTQPWQDETLAVYGMLQYIGCYEGEAARSLYIEQVIEKALRDRDPAPVTPGSPLDAFSGLSQYTAAVYHRGTALWLALEKLMGRDALSSALADYQRQYRFLRPTRTDLLRLLSDRAGLDVTPLAADYLDTFAIN